ncbi:MAG: CPBP family intramembrane glutamic endopeptidase, partial [Gemmataceae bacterium]
MTRDILTVALAVPICLGFAASEFWVLRHGWRALFPPPLRDRFIRWGWAEIILAFVLLVLVPQFAFLLLKSIGLFQAVYGDDPDLAAPQSELFQRCMYLWAATLALPVATAITLVLVRFISGTRLRHFGLRRTRLPDRIAAGFVTWSFVAPLVFGVHFLIVYAQNYLLHWPVQKHPLEQLIVQDSRPAEWVLLVLQAVLFAPVWEELLFRGLLMPRLAKHAWGGHAAMIAALLLAGLHLDRNRSLESAAPLIFVGLVWLVGGLATAGEAGPYRRRRAILGSATLFAALHANAWPSPIPLLFLGLALGWLADRTRGIVAPIVLHGL